MTLPPRQTTQSPTRKRRRHRAPALLASLSALGLLGVMTTASATAPPEPAPIREPVGILDRIGPAEFEIAGLEEHDGNLTITEPGTVIDGLYVKGSINVRADDVTIRNTVVAYGGYHSIRIFHDADGTQILDSSVYCLRTHTNGIVFSNYDAEGVSLYGCRNDFMGAEQSRAVVIDSFIDGQPYSSPDREEPVAPEPPQTGLEPEPTPEPAPSDSSGSDPDPTDPTNPDPTRPEPTEPSNPDPNPAPAPSGFPNASNTGVPAGVDLSSSGSFTVTEDGAVIDGRHVNGTITVRADDVTIRNTLIEGGGNGYPIRITDGASNTLVEHVEIDNQGGGGIGILIDGGSTNTTVRYADIHSAEDGIRIQADNVTIEYSFIHDMHRQEGGHHDTVQIRSGDNITLRGNNLQAYVASTDDPMNAAIQIGSLAGSDQISNLVVTGNLMNGGNFTVNGGGRDEVDSARYSGNMFGRDFRYGVAGNLDNSVWESSNVWYDTREPVS